MANSLKELMGLSEAELIGLGAQYGLTFHTGMKKSHMAQQLSQSAASGWMEVNKQLMDESPDDSYNHMIGFSGGTSDMISDAAHIAQTIAGAGFTETFHATMGGGQQHHVEAINSYMEKLGVSPDDVWMHLPHSNPNEPLRHFGQLNAYMRDTLVGHQDIMPAMQGHYAGDIASEYATNKGGVQDSFNYLAHMYLNKSEYNNEEQYSHDVKQVATRLAHGMGSKFLEVAASAANGAHVSYISSLPQLGSKDVVGNVAHPRQPLNAAGLPLGSMGAAVAGREHYSLSASLAGAAETTPAAKALYADIASTVKSLAGVYRGGKNAEIGMNPYQHITSDRDSIMDSATRYMDVSDARSGYANLTRDLADEPRYSAASIRAVVENNYDIMDAVQHTAPPLSSLSSISSKAIPANNTDFLTDVNAPTSWNAARARREEKAIADLDASHANFRDVSGYGSGEEFNNSSPVFHKAFEQGSPEWLAFRQQYDITGSTIGSYLGNNAYVSPIKEMSDKIGFAGQRSENADMRRGHALEPIARARVAGEIGKSISEVGAITNPAYPRMMYSPDGLIGDDALWEHKAPRKFFDLEDHPDYNDQMQLGMMLSGRSRTLFSQTVGNETRSQWVEADPEWHERNQDKINSTLARMDAGRKFVEDNPDMDEDKQKAGARAAMGGSGIWGFRNQKSGRDYYTGGRRGMSRYSATAGTADDEFTSHAPNYNDIAEDNGYRPNFTMPQGGALVTTGGESSSMAVAVKEGILSAQEENRQRNAAGVGTSPTDEEDADFGDDVYGRPGRITRGRLNRASGGGGFGSGGGGDGGGWFGLDRGGSWDRIVGGIASGSLRGIQSGVMGALKEGGPIGQTIALAAGALGAGGEAISTMSDYRGVAEDYGSTNAIHFDSMTQGMEMMGLNEQQARSVNMTTHSAYNTLQNGDPTGAQRLVVGSRGVLTISDINQTGGDPVALARIFRERTRQRGWSQERIAGAAQMMGLDGFARTATRDARTVDAAGGLVEQRSHEDVSAFNHDSDSAQATRAAVSPTYFAPRLAAENSEWMGPISQVMATGYQAGAAGGNSVQQLIESNRQLESGGRDYDSAGNAITSSTGAKYSMQVLPSTAKNPGYGITPAKDDSADEYNRVGRELMQKNMEFYGGDWRKASAAYTDGRGAVQSAMAKAQESGGLWEDYLPQQAKNRIHDLEKAGWSGGNAQTFQTMGSNGGFGNTPAVINLNINAKVNNQSASATASATGGMPITQTINMSAQAQSRR